METELSGRVVLVTGASGGIGAELARAFHREGARVVVHYARNADRAFALIKELGPTSLAIAADLTSESDSGRLFREVERDLGRVDVLVANAGYWPPDSVPVHEMSLEQWNRTLAVDLTSVFLCVREFFRGIVKHRIPDPAVVLIGSTAGLIGEAGHVDYAAAKAGLIYGMARTLKNEICRIAPQGRVNVVCPGWTITPMTESFTADSASVRRVLQTIPLRKLASPLDVAMAVLYLASSRLAGHVTGEIITVAGGMEGRVLYREDEIGFNLA
jgi:3-oxoacyl-[acyl-carrier protein] reductase